MSHHFPWGLQILPAKVGTIFTLYIDPTLVYCSHHTRTLPQPPVRRVPGGPGHQQELGGAGPAAGARAQDQG